MLKQELRQIMRELQQLVSIVKNEFELPIVLILVCISKVNSHIHKAFLKM
jgi:hypothetical protein